ncbi:hypothetical protein DFP72DRAFT_882765 [Ephemerocybe angulata]|uniref:Uncharacterized protein n=1 Tax=Ephemerocybe angulata TaxID=980116 RepID=A0A8H6IA33_9AGAR|nr:hypothetical protein DFP72DRAFT_882765 [Tulosesus angulatus]
MARGVQGVVGWFDRHDISDKFVGEIKSKPVGYQQIGTGNNLGLLQGGGTTHLGFSLCFGLPLRWEPRWQRRQRVPQRQPPWTRAFWTPARDAGFAAALDGGLCSGLGCRLGLGGRQQPWTRPWMQASRRLRRGLCSSLGRGLCLRKKEAQKINQQEANLDKKKTHLLRCRLLSDASECLCAVGGCSGLALLQQAPFFALGFAGGLLHGCGLSLGQILDSARPSWLWDRAISVGGSSSFAGHF